MNDMKYLSLNQDVAASHISEYPSLLGINVRGTINSVTLSMIFSEYYLAPHTLSHKCNWAWSVGIHDLICMA